jgi:RNA polymerase subunit RPABC4/transcription elongation factor Spt4
MFMGRLANFRYYSKKMLLALMLVYVVNLLLVLVPIAVLGSFSDIGVSSVARVLSALVNIGVLFFIIQAIFVMLYDWSGAMTLRGWTSARIMKDSLLSDFKMLYVVLYLFFPEIMLPIYLARIVVGRRQEEEQKRLERKHYIASLEARLGILPPTAGACRACDKPLQVGAEFCQNCGAPVVEQPKVCPHCGTITLPDAKWCPKCGRAMR